MSELRDLLKIATDEHEDLRRRSNEIHRQMDPLDTQMSDLKIAIIQEEKLLAKTPWRLYLHSAGRHGGASTFGLSVVGSWDDYPELRDLLKPDYHTTDYLAFEKHKNRRGEESRHYVVDLHWSDGDMSLDFDSDEIGQKFIQDFGITVDISSLEEEKVNAQKALDSVTATLAQVNATLAGSK